MYNIRLITDSNINNTIRNQHLDKLGVLEKMIQIYENEIEQTTDSYLKSIVNQNTRLIKECKEERNLIIKVLEKRNRRVDLMNMKFSHEMACFVVNKEFVIDN